MQLTPQEMLQQYYEAVATKYVTDIHDNAHCDSDSGCNNCPAQQACDQLSYNHEKEEADYKTFVTNFKEHILPLLPIKE